MRLTVAAFGVLFLTPAAAPAMQVHIGVEVGPVLWSDLVQDSIVTRLAVRPNTAFGIGGHLTTQVGDGWGLGALVHMSRSDLVAHEAEGPRTLVGLTVWQAAVLVERPLTGRLTGEGTAGLLFYRPAFDRGTLFQDGAPRPLAGGLGLRYDQPLGDWLEAQLRIRWDAHQFTTQRLRVEGFIDSRLVHRLSLSFGLMRVFGDDTP